VSSDSEATAPPRSRARAFLASRSTAQRVAAGIVLVIVCTALFGGFKRSPTDDYAPLHLGRSYDIGPFYLTFDKVETLSDLAPAISPQKKGDRLLVIEITITNHTDHPESTSLAIGTIGGDHTGLVPWPDDITYAEDNGLPIPTEPSLKTFNVADATEMDDETVNPGQTYQLAMVGEQAPGWDPNRLILSLQGMVFEEDDATTLAPPHWVRRTYVAQGHVDVETKP
jgi:hypothetical protein